MKESLKFCVAAEAAGSHIGDFELVQANDTLSLQTPAGTIDNPNAICRYIAAASGDDKLCPQDLQVDQWLEWEERVVQPLLRRIANEGFSETESSSLTDVDSFLKGKHLLVGDTFSLADVVVGSSAIQLRNLVGQGKCPGIDTYCSNLEQNEHFINGKKAMEDLVSSLNKGNASVSARSNATSLLEDVARIFGRAIAQAFPSLQNEEAIVTRATNPKFGHYQCNNAMRIYNMLKSEDATVKNPRMVAQKLIDNVPETSLFEKLEIAGPGFINCYLNLSFVEERISHLLAGGVQPPQIEHKKVLVDFSSPNVAKEMHVGHLRSTIIGESICRVLEFVGYEVMRVNHVGDWGTQFGMLICHLMDAYPEFHTQSPHISDLTAFYKAAKARFDAEPEFKKRSQLQVVKLQQGDKDAYEMWKLLCEVSRQEFDKVYKRLDVTLNEYGESFYNDMIPDTIAKLEAKNLVQDDDGARVVFIPNKRVPLMVKKRDGGYGYDSTDITAVDYRFNKLGCDWALYVVDAGQGDHFDLVFEAAKMAGFVDESKHRIQHLGFGLVCGDDGKKFKTRSGETVKLVDLLDEAKDRMRLKLEERVEAGLSEIRPEEVPVVAEAIGYSAVKYFDLRQNPMSNYVFNYDRMLSTSGDTAVYLLFAHARLASIIQKSGVDMKALKEKAKSNCLVRLTKPSEIALAAELLCFQDITKHMLKYLQPNVLCEYLYSIADKVSSFVTECRVLNSPEMESRLVLCESAAMTMRAVFKLLAIRPLYQI